MQVDVTNFEGKNMKFDYEKFRLGSEEDSYRLEYTTQLDHTKDGFKTFSKGKNFSTVDRDSSNVGCANKYKGAWWYFHTEGTTNMCHNANLNGQYHHSSNSEHGMGLEWAGRDISMMKTMMKLKLIKMKDVKAVDV